MVLIGGVNAQPIPAPVVHGDSLIIHEGAPSFSAGSFEGTCLKGDAVTLASTDGKSKGLYTSPVIALACPAQQIIPSWNILCAPEEGWQVQLQVKNVAGETSPWFYLGSDGQTVFSGEKIGKCPWAKVAIDAIILEKPAMTVQYRVIFQGLRSSPFLKLFALASRHAPPVIDDDPDQDLMGKMMPIPVRCRSQCVEAKNIASRICCPTSTSMVLEFLGVNLPTAYVAAMLYNRENDIYGIWWGPPQLACQLGFKGWTRIFSSWKDVQQVLAGGQPIIASISFGKGELKGAPVSSTKGHIVVVTGFDEEGRVLVNDPAGKNAEACRIAYDRLEFAKAWFGHGGVAMIITKKN
jgi:hypothetical protein